MKLMILSGFCAVLIFAGVAEGRLGWTHEQCVQSFGEPVGEVETKLVKSEGKAEVFKTQIGDLPLFVLVEYQKGRVWMITYEGQAVSCLLYTSPSPRDRTRSRMPSSA